MTNCGCAWTYTFFFFGLTQYLMQVRLFSCSASCPWSPFSNMFQRISTERNRSWPVGSGSIKREQTVVAASALSIWSQFLSVIQIIKLFYKYCFFSFESYHLYYVLLYNSYCWQKHIFNHCVLFEKGLFFATLTIFQFEKSLFYFSPLFSNEYTKTL